MTKIRRLYSYKGEFIGLDNYKYLSFLYDKDGETKITIENSLLMLALLGTTFMGGYAQLLTPISYPLLGTNPSLVGKLMGVTLANAKHFIL